MYRIDSKIILPFFRLNFIIISRAIKIIHGTFCRNAKLVCKCSSGTTFLVTRGKLSKKSDVKMYISIYSWLVFPVAITNNLEILIIVHFYRHVIAIWMLVIHNIISIVPLCLNYLWNYKSISYVVLKVNDKDIHYIRTWCNIVFTCCYYADVKENHYESAACHAVSVVWDSSDEKKWLWLPESSCFTVIISAYPANYCYMASSGTDFCNRWPVDLDIAWGSAHRKRKSF